MSEKQYRMPAEWSPHARTMLAWPVKDSLVYPENYNKVCAGYEELILAISEFEPVLLVVNPDDEANVAPRFTHASVELISLPHNDAWLRDNGPTFVRDDHHQLFGVNWGFNAWGEKYEPWDLDDEVAPALLSFMKVPVIDAPLILEGGSIHVDGEGTLLTTEECLLNPNRNPHLTKKDVEEHLKPLLGLSKIVWLPLGLDGDETDGHIDNVACFAAPGKVIIQVCNDPEDVNYARSQEHLDILRKETDATGRSFEIIQIEQPPYREVEGQRLTLSYINFYLVNDGLILPVFGGDATDFDKKAEEILQKAFPERTIRTIDGMAVIQEGGNVHCTTQQVPAEGKNK
ncbi:agmatine deiminase [Alkalicoccobacillus murimartini]|uniref:Agmatine deiminase n=2 Tax=Alkalicoccobacillus murimartini TaxID=171685 RepID=A0ABT9YIP8_9BACI|nr:agmatine deiminase family protein [Alkalicoccobacillus murimartini]MDQ0207738.1 agmatine deiminase [Alkalicoccobacillus murimartini]